MLVITLTTSTQVYFILLNFLAFFKGIIYKYLLCKTYFFFTFIVYVQLSLCACLSTYGLGYHEEKFRFPFQCSGVANGLFSVPA